MAHDVFISYSSKDKPVADAACATFEAAGMRCWIAPRDVPPGAAWGGAIVDAIQKSRVMVLIFSENANTSGQIAREVERAADYGVTIVPIRVEDVTPAQSLQYFLSNIHWLDALSPPLERRLQEIAAKIQPMLGDSGGASPPPVPGVTKPQPQPQLQAELPPQPQLQPARSINRWLLAGLGTLFLLFLLLVAIMLIWRPWTNQPKEKQAEASTPPAETPSRVSTIDPALVGRWTYVTTFLDAEVHIELSIDAAGRYTFRTFLKGAGTVQLKNGKGVVTDARNGNVTVASYVFPSEDELIWTSPTADPNTKIVLNYKRVGGKKVPGNRLAGRWHATTLYAGLMWDADWIVEPDSSFQFLFENIDEGTLVAMNGQYESSSSVGRSSGRGIYRNVTPDSFEMSHPVFQMLRFERADSNSGR